MNDITTRFQALRLGAVLDVFLLESTNHDLSRLIQDQSADKAARIPSRKHIFFDEYACVSILLKTSINEDELREILPGLEITLTAHATDAVPQGPGNTASASGKHDLTSMIVRGSSFDSVAASGKSSYVLWRPKLHLARPRVRLQRPAVYFTVYLSVGTEALNASNHKAAEFMQSFEPLSGNTLRPLLADPSFADAEINLSETKIAKAPSNTPRSSMELKPLRAASKRAVPIVPAMFLRVKTSVLPDTLVASLHLEASRLIPDRLTIGKLAFDVPDAQIEEIGQVKFPTELQAVDEVVALYRLSPTTTADPKSPSQVSVDIEACLSSQGAAPVDVKVKWQAQIDLSQKQFKADFKWSRPLSTGSQQTHRSSLKETDRPSVSAVNLTSTTSETGMVFNFTAPSAVASKDIFQVHVQCINRSDRSRRFALLSLPPKKAVQQNQAAKSGDATRLFNGSTVEALRSPDVRNLSPDTRIGPMPPASYETSMKFQAMRTGILDLGIVRIVDLDTRRTVDANLPEVVAFDSLRVNETATSGDDLRR